MERFRKRNTGNRGEGKRKGEVLATTWVKCGLLIVQWAKNADVDADNPVLDSQRLAYRDGELRDSTPRLFKVQNFLDLCVCARILLLLVKS